MILLPTKFAFEPVVSICGLSLLGLSLRCEPFALSRAHSHLNQECRKLITEIGFLQLHFALQVSKAFKSKKYHELSKLHNCATPVLMYS